MVSTLYINSKEIQTEAKCVRYTEVSLIREVSTRASSTGQPSKKVELYEIGTLQKNDKVIKV